MKTNSERLYVLLEKVADAGEVCPVNPELAAAISIGTRAVTAAFRELRDLGLVEVRRVGDLRVVTLTQLDKQTVDPTPPPKPVILKPRIDDIARTASEVFNIPYGDIMSRSRFKEHVEARFAVVHVASQRGWTGCAIGRAIGRDHSTVKHARDSAMYRVERDEDFDFHCAAILRRHPLQEITLAS